MLSRLSGSDSFVSCAITLRSMAGLKATGLKKRRQLWRAGGRRDYWKPLRIKHPSILLAGAANPT